MASRSRARPAARLANQPLEIEAAISGPEQGNLDGVRRESLIAAAPGDLAEKIDVAEGGCQLEVETLTQCSGRPLERESRGAPRKYGETPPSAAASGSRFASERS